MKKAYLLTAIMMILAIALLATSCGNAQNNLNPTNNGNNGKITIVGSTSVGPHIDAIAKLYMAKNQGVSIEVEQVGSGQGIANTLDGVADIGISSRELKDSEKSLMVFRMAKDGLALVVHKDNPVANLTKAQVKDIYTGKITNWKDVGGNDAAINLYTRESTSGTRGGFEELVLGKDAAGKQMTIDEKLMAAVLNSSGNLASSVEKDKNAIGYISLGIAPQYAGLKAVSLDGTAATIENVSNGTYTLQRDFLMLTRSEPTGKVKDFIEFVLNSSEAKDYLAKNGLVPATK